MTETDNPKVKEHLGLKDGQLLKRIEEIDDNERDFQKMFESREVKPVISLGYYNPKTKKYVLGPNSGASVMTPSIQTSTTSAATSVLTCAAGYTYKVIACGYSNSTRATNAKLELTVSGGSAKIITHGTTAALATHIWHLIGGENPRSNAVGWNVQLSEPVWLSAGDALTITDLTFQAADSMYYFYLYERYEAVV